MNRDKMKLFLYMELELWKDAVSYDSYLPLVTFYEENYDNMSNYFFKQIQNFFTNADTMQIHETLVLALSKRMLDFKYYYQGLEHFDRDNFQEALKYFQILRQSDDLVPFMYTPLYYSVDHRMPCREMDFISYRMAELIKDYSKIAENHLISEIKSTIIELGVKHARVEIKDIVEKSNIKNEDLIIITIHKMIKNKEIYAEYFSNSRALLFDKFEDIEEIDELLDTYSSWENKKVGKKEDKNHHTP